MNPDDRNRPLSANAKRLLAQVGLLIDLLEARLRDLEQLEKTKGESTINARRPLRARIQACYAVRLSLMRGQHADDTDLDRLVTKTQVRMEHRRFEGKPAIGKDEITACDIQELARKLIT